MFGTDNGWRNIVITAAATATATADHQGHNVFIYTFLLHVFLLLSDPFSFMFIVRNIIIEQSFMMMIRRFDIRSFVRRD